MRGLVRSEARKIVKALDKDYVANASDIIYNKLFEYLEDKIDLTSHSTKVFIYNSYGNEVDTHGIIERMLSLGADVYLPIVRGNIMLPVSVDKDTEYVVGDYGIMEPVGKIYDGEFDLSVTPLLAYDRDLNRMGKGKGYYDRFFSGHKVGHIVGLAFKRQEVESTYPEPHDFRLNAIINEEEVICE